MLLQFPEGITIDVDGELNTPPDLYEVCPFCNAPYCCHDCDESKDAEKETESEVAERHQHNGAIDGVTSLILACYKEGIAVNDPAFQIAVQTALDAITNNT